jgi:hypothetical protein
VALHARLASSLLHSDANEACDAMFVAGPVALAWSRFAEDVRDRVRARYLDAIEPWREGTTYALPAEFVCLHAKADGM